MIKTRSGTKKRVKITATGKIILGQANNRHLLSNKSKKSKLRNRYGLVVDKTEERQIRRQLPFSF